MSEDQATINGREIPALAKAGVYEELKNERIRCQDCQGSILAKFYVGRDDDGVPRAWAWLPARVAAGGEKVPPSGLPVPTTAGELVFTDFTQCARCRATWIVFPGGPPPALSDLPNGGTTGHMVLRVGPSHSEHARVGDRTLTGQVTADRVHGPAAFTMVRMNRPTWGAVRGGSRTRRG